MTELLSAEERAQIEGATFHGQNMGGDWVRCVSLVDVLALLATVETRAQEQIEKLEKEKAEDAWHQGWQVAVRERDEERRAHDETARGFRIYQQETEGQTDRLAAQRDAAEAECARLRDVIRWALGENGTFFVPEGKGHGRFWWRTELRKRAALAASKGTP